MIPALFVSHGSPMVAIENDDYAVALRRFAQRAARPTSIVVLSAHWEAQGPVRVTAAPRPALIYDFAGFPDDLYRLVYPSPGSPLLADEIVRMLADHDISSVSDPTRGLDHGAWIPLSIAYPDPGIPIVQISLPLPRDPDFLMRIGKTLSPLRADGVLLVGSGGVVHNIRRTHFDDANAKADSWAAVFDAWVRTTLEDDPEALPTYRTEAPAAELAVPSTEHFDPLFFVLGASLPGDRLVDIYEGFRYGNLSMRCLAFEAA